MAVIPVRIDRVTWESPIAVSDGIEGPNERCIEYPLGLEVADLSEMGLVLDAGCALLPALNQLPKRPDNQPWQAHVWHVTQDLQSEPCPHHPRRSYRAADLRDLSCFPDQYFDRSVCLSTLEHVGMDNRTYGGPCEQDPESVHRALSEIWRVTKDRLLITVPYTVGPAISNGRWRHFSASDWTGLLAGVTGQIETRFYGLMQGKWCGGAGPMQADPDTFPKRVHQIAAALVTR